MWHSVGFYRRRGMLRPLILRLLEAGPLSGMELMDLIERRSHHHRWRPSPGSIYPRLKELSDEGLIRKRGDGRYELATRASRSPGARWTPGPRTAAEVVTEIEGLTEYLEDLARADPVRDRADPVRIDALVERWARLRRGPSSPGGP